MSPAIAPRPLRPGPCARRLPAIAALVVALSATLPATGAEAADSLPRTRGGYSRNLVRNANDNDVRSALRAYAAVISNANHISSDPDQQLYQNVAEMERSLRDHAVDVVVAPSDEFLALPPDLLEPPYATSQNAGVVGVEYVLLSRRDGPVATPADLLQRRVGLLDSSQGSLAAPWLEALLAQHGLTPPATALSQLKLCAKPSLAALPVFFKQLDACIITRASFITLCELNPQLERQLRTIASSPRFLPVLSGFRRGVEPRLKQSIIKAMSTLDSTVAGRQLLTLFQTDRLAFCEESELGATRQLVAGRAVSVPPSR